MTRIAAAALLLLATAAGTSAQAPKVLRVAPNADLVAFEVDSADTFSMRFSRPFAVVEAGLATAMGTQSAILPWFAARRTGPRPDPSRITTRTSHAPRNCWRNAATRARRSSLSPPPTIRCRRNWPT